MATILSVCKADYLMGSIILMKELEEIKKRNNYPEQLGFKVLRFGSRFKNIDGIMRIICKIPPAHLEKGGDQKHLIKEHIYHVTK